MKLPQNQNAGKRVRARASLVDIAPTILEIAGVPVPSQMQGQSLLRIAKSNSDQPAYSVSDFPQQAFGWSALESWRAGKYLYIRAPKPELYDLAADPGATHNLAQTSKATLETIAGATRSLRPALQRRGELRAGPNCLPVKCRSWLRWDMSGCRNRPSSASAAATGVDPKDGIATANKILSAERLLDEGKPERRSPPCNR